MISMFSLWIYQRHFNWWKVASSIYYCCFLLFFLESCTLYAFIRTKQSVLCLGFKWQVEFLYFWEKWTRLFKVCFTTDLTHQALQMDKAWLGKRCLWARPGASLEWITWKVFRVGRLLSFLQAHYYPGKTCQDQILYLITKTHNLRPLKVL